MTVYMIMIRIIMNWISHPLPSPPHMSIKMLRLSISITPFEISGRLIINIFIAKCVA